MRATPMRWPRCSWRTVSSSALPSRTSPIRAARPSAKASAPDRRVFVTRHIVANTVVDVVNAAEARAHSYLLLYTAPATETGLPKADAKQLLGAFDDRIVRDSDGAWKFRERRGSLAMTIGG